MNSAGAIQDVVAVINAIRLVRHIEQWLDATMSLQVGQFAILCAGVFILAHKCCF